MGPALRAALDGCAPLFRHAPEPFRADLAAALAAGRMQLWPADNARACVLSEVLDFRLRGQRVLQVRVLGDATQGDRLLPGVLAWARVAGCTEHVVHHGFAPTPAERPAFASLED